MKNQKEDSQALEILDIIQCYATGDFSVSANLYGKNDIIDALAMGINMMGEELEASRKERDDKIGELEKSHKALNATRITILEEKEKYKSLTENITIGIFRSTMKGRRFIEVNPAMVSIFGYKNRRELLAVNPVDLYANPNDRILLIRKLGEKGYVKNVEINYKKKDGSIITCLVSAVSQFEKSGQIDYFDGHVEDITIRKQVETALKISEENFRILFDYAPDAYYISNLKGTFVDGNKAAQKILGYNKEELIGKSFIKLNILDKIQVLRAAKLLALNILGKPTGPDEFILKRKDGRKISAEILTYPVKMEGKTVVLGIARDITERKKTESNLKERMKELQCLYSIAEITERPGITLDELYQEVVNLLPPGWQYPEITCCRIRIEGKNYQTDNFTETKWKQRAGISLKNHPIGIVEVYYLEKKPDIFEGPFLREERNLINSIAKRLGEYTEQKLGAAELIREKELLNALIDNSPDNFFFKDKKSRFIRINKNQSNRFGLRDPAEAIGKTDFDFFTEEHASEAFEDEQEVMRTNRNMVGKEEKETWIDGTETWVSTTKLPLYDAKRKIIGTCGISRDVTEQRKLQNEIAESEVLLNSITTSAQDGIIVIDYDGNVIFWNDSAETIFGYSAEEITGKNFHESIAPEKYQQSYRKGYNKFRNSGTGAAVGKTLELSALHKDGKEFPVELSLSAIKINNNWHGVGIIRDITKRKEIEGQLEEAKMQAEQANQAKSEFLANMSHEIRTPMNAILGFAEILEDQLTTTPEYHDYITGIRNSGKGLLGLINDILDLSKIEAGKLEINYESINPYAIIDEISQIYSLKTKEKKLSFEINIDPDLPKGLLFDETRLRQILFNLIGNAIKFTNKGGITVKFKSKNGREEGSFIDLFIEVIDTGIGICKKSQQIIFEPFRQKDGQSTRRYGGTGLGLTITRRLVNLMNGTISLKSEVDKGSTFKIFLPHIQVSALVESPASEAEDVSGIEFKNPQILLVEDVESNRKVVRGYLESCNVRIIEAENGSIGIELTKKFKPDLILMDMQMPGIDGYEATGIIKAEKELKNIPIVALTASSLKREKSKIENLCDGYLRKPVSKSLLISELKKFLPFTKQEKPEEKGGKQEIDYIYELKQLALQENRIPKELVDIFRNSLIPEYENILKNRSNKRIRNFASMISETGKEFNVDVLENYGMELEEYLDSFNVKKINALLADFKKMAEIISK